jgi:glycosyltransferase involved in cell wall biosynthesis
MNILIPCDYYLPGFQAGGALRSLSNMVERLGEEFHFKVITRDRDLGDKQPYKEISRGNWQPVGKAEVFYLSPGKFSMRRLRRLMWDTKHDVVYLNSFFSPHFTIKPLFLRRLGLLPKKPVILAPRGEFSSGSFGLKRHKKQIYHFLSKFIGLYTGVIWQASAEHEKVDILRLYGNSATVAIARDLPFPQPDEKNQVQPHKKTGGRLKLVFLGRISREKNLDGALRILIGLAGKVEFNIFGPLEDGNYWTECQRIINMLSENIVVQYRGAVPYDRVRSVLEEHDLFFLPTLGENFGHVILEALVAGCPLLISNRTPWQDLEEKGIGWNLPLEHEESFREVLHRFVMMDHQEYTEFSKRAKDFGYKVLRDDDAVKQNRQLFNDACCSVERPR